MIRFATFLVSLLALTTVSVAPVLVSAQGQVPNPPNPPAQVPNPPNDSSSGCQGLCNPLKDINSFEDLLAKILEAVVQIGFIFVTLALVWVGFKFVAAQGREEELRNAKAALLWTVIGALILLGIQAIASVIQETAKSLT